MPDALAKELVGRFSQHEGVRNSQFLPTWQSLADYFLPSESAINTKKLPGTTSAWTDRVFNTVPIHCGQVLSAGQRNWLTPSNETWFDYEPPDFLAKDDDDQNSDPDPDRDDAIQWMARATEICRRELSRSNFYGQANIDYEQCGIFGTGMLYVEEGKKTSLNFRQFKPWFLGIEEDDEGVVDTVFREFELTTRQAVQQFGLDKLPADMQKAYDEPAKLGQRWKFLHFCGPRDDSKRIKGRMDGPNKPWASVYIALQAQVCVEVSGYEEMPYLCSRFKSWGAPTAWGYGPAYLCLPVARQINYVGQYRDALAELKAYPRFYVPDTVEGDVDLRAGGGTVVPAEDLIRGAVPKEWMTQGDDKAAEANMEEKRQELFDAFYVNMFQMLEQLADKKMTAYEIAQRLAEKLEQFTPVFDRRVTEFLNPLLLRVFGILYRQGKFGPAPKALLVPVDGGKSLALAMPVVAITSRISMALKALQNTAIVNTLSMLQPMAQAGHPEVFDNFDMDALVRKLARNYGMSPDLLASVDARDKVRAQRQQQAAAQQAAELAQRLGGTVKDLGGAPKPLQDAVMDQFGVGGGGGMGGMGGKTPVAA